MSGVLLKHINPDLPIGLIPLTVQLTQTDDDTVNTQVVAPGFIHRLEGVTAHCAAKTGAVTVDVQRGAGGTILDAAIAPAAGTTAPTAGVIAAASVTALDQLGKADQKWRIVTTVPAAGAVIGLSVTLWFRPYPCKGDFATVPATE